MYFCLHFTIATSACDGQIETATPNTCQTQSAKSPPTNTITIPNTIKENKTNVSVFFRFFNYRTSKTHPEKSPTSKSSGFRSWAVFGLTLSVF